MTKLIIFDWDDVFTLGSTRGYCDCYKAGVDSVLPGIEMRAVRKATIELWGRPSRHVFARILENRHDLIEKAYERYEECLFSNTLFLNLSFVSQGNEVLQRLGKKYKLAIASGIHPELLKEYVMPKFNVPKEIFVQIISAYDLPDHSRGKPHPDMIQAILAAQDIKPDEAVMVGDAVGDVRMALSAGVRPIVVLTGQLNRQGAMRLGVKDIIPSVADLESALE